MKKNSLLQRSAALLLSGLWVNGWASPYNDTMSVVSTALSMVFSLCEITGVIFIGMGFIRYQQYRQNPSETPLSRVLYVLLFGLAMLILPYIAQKAAIHKTIQQAADVTTPNS